MDTQALRLKLKDTPLPIRSWFASEEVSLMIQTINQHFNLKDESGTVLPKLLLRLEAKDIQPDYFAGELSEELKIEKEKALGISAEVERTILGPVKKDFSDIGIETSLLEKFQVPIIKGLNPSAPNGNGPTIIQDIGPSKPTSIQTNTATSQTVSSAPNLSATAIPNVNIPPAVPSKTNRLSDIGWSRSQTAAPVVKLDISQVPAKPTASAAPMQQQPPSISRPTTPINPSLGEFERLNAMKRAPGMSPAAVTAAGSAPIPSVPMPAPAHPAGPAPVMLHQDTTFSVAAKNADFKIGRPPESADMHLGSVKPQSTIKPAVLEFGGQPTKPATPTPSTTSSAVHYTQFQPSLSTFPTQNSGARHIDQIMPAPSVTPPSVPSQAASIPVPRPPQPPTASGMPRVPMPPVPSTHKAPEAAKEQVIVKDFL